MKNNNRVELLTWLLFVWMLGSILGASYGLIVIVVGLLIYLWGLALLPREHHLEKQRLILERVRSGTGCSSTELRMAAEYCMLSDLYDIRREDLPVPFIPETLHPFIKSENDLRRRRRRPY
jgi:hypothetical protein